MMLKEGFAQWDLTPPAFACRLRLLGQDLYVTRASLHRDVTQLSAVLGLHCPAAQVSDLVLKSRSEAFVSLRLTLVLCQM